MSQTPKSEPQKRRIQTPAGILSVEVKEPIENINFPKGPCPIIHNKCVKDGEICGFWVEALGLEQSVLGTQKPIIIGSCIFYATMNIAMTPKFVQAPNQNLPNEGGSKYQAS